ncbi:MAG: UDP-N-acetylmuramate dehydrogenase [Psychrobium sp.]
MALTSLQTLNTFALAASADDYLAISELSQLKKQLPLQQPFLVLGGGSNMLFCQSYQGLILHNQLLGIEHWEDENHYYFKVAGGENWHEFVMYCAERDIGGLENLALIPGSVGAAPVQNIGAYGVEIADICQQVMAIDLLTGEDVIFSHQQCQFAYRESVFKAKRHYFIHHVVFKLPKAWTPILDYGELKAWAKDRDSEISPLSVANEVIAVRNNKLPDPAELPNVGSFFKNPVVSKPQAMALLSEYPQMPQYDVGDEVKLAAGWLIDQLGLKGYQIGGASVHQRQALVLVNTDNATSQDVVSLATYIIERVLMTYGVELEPEVNIIANGGYSSLAQLIEEQHV